MISSSFSKVFLYMAFAMVLMSNAYKFLVRNEFFKILMILFSSSGCLSWTGGVKSSISVRDATGLLNTEPMNSNKIFDVLPLFLCKYSWLGFLAYELIGARDAGALTLKQVKLLMKLPCSDSFV